VITKISFFMTNIFMDASYKLFYSKIKLIFV
jgi:hypothetical protein